MGIFESYPEIIGGFYRLILIVGSGTALTLAFSVFQQRHLNGAKWLFAILLCATEIQICFLMQTFSHSTEMAFFWSRLRFFGMLFILPFVFLYVIDTTSTRPMPGWGIGLLMVIPVITQIVLWWGNLAMTFFFAEWVTERYGSLLVEHIRFADWYVVVSVFMATLFVLSILRLASYAHQQHGNERRRAIWLLITIIIAYGSTIPASYFSNPFHLNLTPIGVAIFAITAGWAFRARLFNLTPIAYETIVQNMRGAVLVLNADHQVVQANPSAHNLFQTPKLVGQSVRTLGLPEPFLEQYFRLDATVHEEFTVSLGSKAIPYQITLSPILTRQQMYGRILIFQNIEAKQKAETSLRENEARYRMMVESPHSGTYILGSNKQFTYVNQELARILGGNPEDFVGKQVDNFLTPESLQIMTSQYAQDIGHGIMVRRYEDLTLVALDGSHHPVQVASTDMVTASGEPQVIGQVVDMTTRRNAEQALRESESRYRGAIEASLDTYFLLESVRDANGNIADFNVVQANSNAIKELNVSREQMLNGSFCAVFPNAATDGTLERYKQVVCTGNPSVQDFEIPAARPNAGWYQSQVVRVGDGVAVTHRNITERKKAEQRELELRLEKERMHILSNFIEKASHEFRTPLTVILSASSFMAKLDDAERRQMKLARVEQQVMRMTKLVDMLLVMTRLESHSNAELFPVNITRVIRAECQTLTERYGEKPELIYQLTEGMPLVMGNMNDLADAFQQILDNAYRYTPKDGTITVTGGVEGNHIWLDIRDTGVGISPEAMPHIFETFWRQDEPHSTPGFGLGLSIAQRVMEMHNGTIRVESELDRGTTVHLTLPISEAPIRVWK